MPISKILIEKILSSKQKQLISDSLHFLLEGQENKSYSKEEIKDQAKNMTDYWLKHQTVLSLDLEEEKTIYSFIFNICKNYLEEVDKVNSSNGQYGIFEVYIPSLLSHHFYSQLEAILCYNN